MASIVVERSSRSSWHPELNLVSGRGMELLRRLGLADLVRSDGVDPDRSAATAWSRSFGESPILVTPMPSVNELRRQYAGTTDGSAPVEPYALLTGVDLATRLRDCVRAHPLIDLREGWIFTDLRLEPGRTFATPRPWSGATIPPPRRPGPGCPPSGSAAANSSSTCSDPSSPYSISPPARPGAPSWTRPRRGASR
ncbi:MAG TPA: hypothetical protein VFG35_28115 [Actinoplanes sp.]|nr:hypothetical protein [Actinoplanes sp.]